MASLDDFPLEDQIGAARMVSGIPSRYRAPVGSDTAPGAIGRNYPRDWQQFGEEFVKANIPLEGDTEEERIRKIMGMIGPSAIGMLGGAYGAAKTGGKVAEKFLAGEQAAAEGAFPHALWKNFGYAKGAEGKGRFEISDVPAQFKSSAGEGSGALKDFLEHPELFKAYPELLNRPFEFRMGPEMERIGKFSPSTGGFFAQGKNQKEILNTLLHELQHGVQRLEGFPSGANLSQGLDKYMKKAGEVEARNVQARWRDPEFMQFPPFATEDIPRVLQIIKSDPGAALDVIKGPWKPKGSSIRDQINAQMPRLQQEFERRIASQAPDKLPIRGEPQDVSRLLFPKVEGPTVKHFLGEDYPRYGGDIYYRYPASKEYMRYQKEHPEYGSSLYHSFNMGGVGRDFATKEDAYKALLRRVIEHGRLNPETFKPVKPQISEFASPESARKSWRVIPEE